MTWDVQSVVKLEGWEEGWVENAEFETKDLPLGISPSFIDYEKYSRKKEWLYWQGISLYLFMVMFIYTSEVKT